MPLKTPDKPPAPRAKTQSRPVSVVSPEQRITARREAGEGFLQLLAFGCTLKGWTADAGAITKHGPRLAEEAAKVAESDETTARCLDFLGMAGPLAGLLTAALPLGLQLIANRRIVPAAALSSMGVVEPEVLEAEMRAALLAQQLEAKRQAAAREAELRRMLAEQEREERVQHEYAAAS